MIIRFFLITFKNYYFLKEDVRILMFSHIVNGFFVLFAVWRIVMGMRSPAATALLFPLHSPAGGTELWCSPLPRSRSSTEVWQGRTGKTQLSPLLLSIRLQEWERQPCSARTLEGGHAPQSHFQYGHGILAPSQHWLEGDALATGRGKVLWLVMPHGDQKGRYMPESVRYHLSFLRMAVFKCLLVDDLLPTASSVSPVLRLCRVFGCGLLWSLRQKRNAER